MSFSQTVSVKGSPRCDANQPILFPGEPERITEAQRLREGIPIALATITALREEAARLKVAGDPFGQ